MADESKSEFDFGPPSNKYCKASTFCEPNRRPTGILYKKCFFPFHPQPQQSGKLMISFVCACRWKPLTHVFACFSSRDCLFTLGLLLSCGTDKSLNKLQSKNDWICHWVQHEACASPGLIPVYVTIQIRLAQGHWRGRGDKNEISHNSHSFLPLSPKSSQSQAIRKNNGNRDFLIS